MIIPHQDCSFTITVEPSICRVLFRQLFHSHHSGALPCSAPTGCTAIRVRPRSRSLRISPYSAAWSTTGPSNSVLPSAVWLMVIECSKTGRISYDFVRKRLSILVADGRQQVLITKGALANVLEVCTSVALPDGTVAPLATRRAQIDQYFTDLSTQGLRVLALASRTI